MQLGLRRAHGPSRHRRNLLVPIPLDVVQHKHLPRTGRQRRHVKADRRSVRRECSISDASSMMLARGLLAGAPSKIAAEKEMAQRVRELVEELPEIAREILLLRYIEQLSNAEAAELLDIDPDTARKRHGRALKRLLAAMIESGLANPQDASQR